MLNFFVFLFYLILLLVFESISGFNAGKISERIMSYNSDSGDMIYSYIDRDGDGMLDLFFDHKNGLYYVNSNLCWILRHN